MLSMSNVRELLDLDPDYRYKKYRRGYETSEESMIEDNEDKYEIFLSFQPAGQGTILNLKIAETDNRWF